MIITALALTACGTTTQDDVQTLAQPVVEEKINGEKTQEGRKADQPQPISADELSEDEIAGLLFMREEEKLAHDVYQAMYVLWGMPIFTNIAESELTHTEAVKGLLDGYGIADPAEGLPAGVFSDANLQALYDQLIAQGQTSLVDALMVGAAIEEIDILNLQAHLLQTKKADITNVYENLMMGSRNHLRSFVSTLGNRGVTYQAQYLDSEAYQEIISTSIESGGQGASGGSGNGRGRQ